MARTATPTPDAAGTEAAGNHGIRIIEPTGMLWPMDIGGRNLAWAREWAGAADKENL